MSAVFAEQVEALDGLRRQLLQHMAETPEFGVNLAGDDAVKPRSGPLRTVVVGETKRGKSTLLNALVRRPLLSPVGFDVTTSCWVEVSYGEVDQATVLLADRLAPGTPQRVAVRADELERYVAVAQVSEPVLGVEVRLCEPRLKDLVLVDTPGVGGLVADHAHIALDAVGQADVLLFVADAGQPVLAPEVAFLREAAARVPTILVAITKCDAVYSFQEVVDETRRILAQYPDLRRASLFAVAPPLWDEAENVQKEEYRLLLQAQSGMDELYAALHRQADIVSAIRLTNSAIRTNLAARALLAKLEQAAAILSGDVTKEASLEANIEAVTAAIDDRPYLRSTVDARLNELQTEAIDRFSGTVAALRARFREKAERGPAAQLTELAPTLVAALCTAGSDNLQQITRDSRATVRRLMTQLGALDTDSAAGDGSDPEFRLDLELPLLTGSAGGVGFEDGVRTAGSMFQNMMKILGGSVVLVTVLPASMILAAGIAISAGTGWWKIRTGSEQERRAQLGSWVDRATQECIAGFDTELKKRVRTVRDHVDEQLPLLLAARRDELNRLRAELTTLRHGTSATRAEVLDKLGRRMAGLVTLADALDEQVAALRFSVEAKSVP